MIGSQSGEGHRGEAHLNGLTTIEWLLIAVGVWAIALSGVAYEFGKWIAATIGKSIVDAIVLFIRVL